MTRKKQKLVTVIGVNNPVEFADIVVKVNGTPLDVSAFEEINYTAPRDAADLALAKFTRGTSAEIGKQVHAALEEALAKPIAAPAEPDCTLPDCTTSDMPTKSEKELTCDDLAKLPDKIGDAVLRQRLTERLGKVDQRIADELLRDKYKRMFSDPIPFFDPFGRRGYGKHTDAERAQQWPAGQSRGAVEQMIPLPYVGPPGGVEGTLDVSQFVFEYVSHRFEPDWFGARKHLQLVAKVRPRGDEVHTDGEAPKVDERGLMKIYFGASFEAHRPDAVCIREIFLLALRHELEESIKVNGVRIWDPHVGRPGDI